MRKLLPLRQSLALAAVLAASALSLAAAPASASPGHASAVHPSVITPDTAFTGVQLCEVGDGLCLAGHDGNPGQITANPFATGVAETVNVIDAAECGGTVEYEPNAKPQPVFCPFADHALDNQYRGDDLVVIQNSDNLLTYRADPNPNLNDIVESSGGDGEVWVQAGNLQTSGPAVNLINVKITAKLGSAEALCAGAGTDNPVALTPPGGSGGLCAWRVHS